jgi:ABC-2 type transport system permease protein
VPLFLTQLKFELLKMFARKRTYIGFAAFLLMECVILMICNLRGPQMALRRLIEQNGYGADEYFSGFTLALMIVHWTSTLLGSLYLALIAGDLMAKEVEDGTMRMLLCRPISRLRVTTLKYLSSIVYTFVLIAFIGLTAMLAGLAYRAPGGLFVYFPEDHVFALIAPERALRMYLLGMPLLALSMVSISSIGFLFSCCNMKPAAASIVTLSVIFVDFIFHGIPYFESLKVFFINTHLTAWVQLYQAHPPIWKMAEDYCYLLGLDFTCLIVGSAIFLQRDLK